MIVHIWKCIACEFPLLLSHLQHIERRRMIEEYGGRASPHMMYGGGPECEGEIRPFIQFACEADRPLIPFVPKSFPVEGVPAYDKDRDNPFVPK